MSLKVLIASFVGCCVAGSIVAGCFLWNQEPVCPPSKPACLNDNDPVIWQDTHRAARDGGADAAGDSR